jgi:hypothetical protein
MGEPIIPIRPADDDDRAGILELAPRLAEGVEPWRDQAEALLAGRRWLKESLEAAKTGDGIVLVAADADGIAGGDQRLVEHRCLQHQRPRLLRRPGLCRGRGPADPADSG